MMRNQRVRGLRIRPHGRRFHIDSADRLTFAIPQFPGQTLPSTQCECAQVVLLVRDVVDFWCIFLRKDPENGSLFLMNDQSKAALLIGLRAGEPSPGVRLEGRG